MTSNDTLMTLLRDADGIESHVDYDLEAIKARAVRQNGRARALKTLGGAAMSVTAISSVVYLAVRGPGPGAGKPDHDGQLGGGCGPTASVTAVGGGAGQRAGSDAVLASVRAGSVATVGAMLHITGPSQILGMELIVAKPESKIGDETVLTTMTDLAQPKKQVATSATDSPSTGDQVTVTTPPLAAGSYPVYYLLDYVGGPPCGVGVGLHAREMGRLGVVDVTP